MTASNELIRFPVWPLPGNGMFFVFPSSLHTNGFYDPTRLSIPQGGEAAIYSIRSGINKALWASSRNGILRSMFAIGDATAHTYIHVVAD